MKVTINSQDPSVNPFKAGKLYAHESNSNIILCTAPVGKGNFEGTTIASLLYGAGYHSTWTGNYYPFKGTLEIEVE